MQKSRYAIILLITLIVSSLACNMPAAQPAAEATEEPTEASMEAPESIQTEAPTQAPTEEVPAGVTVSVSTATNCRTGPDVAYQLLMVVQPGSTNVVVGKHTPLNYWIINMPTGGTCWLWGAYAATVGDTSKLPEIVAPAPPPVVQVDQNQNSNNNSEEPKDSGGDNDNSNNSPMVPVIPIIPGVLIPSPPASVNVVKVCQSNFPTITQKSTVTWSAVNGATGYIVYRNGSPIANPGAGATQYIDSFNVLIIMGSQVTYGVKTVIGSSSSNTTDASISVCN